MPSISSKFSLSSFEVEIRARTHWPDMTMHISNLLKRIKRSIVQEFDEIEAVEYVWVVPYILLFVDISETEWQICKTHMLP